MDQYRSVLFLLTIAVIQCSFVVQAVRCPSYCNGDSLNVPAQLCNTTYCCGNRTLRFCCNDENQDTSHRYPNDVSICSSTAWLIYQWQMLLGTMAVMILMIVVAACCCQCCNVKNGGWQGAARSRGNNSRRQNRVGTELATIDVPEEILPSFFDPSNPYAFTPPDYENLAKDPPAYSAIFDERGNFNLTFDDVHGTLGGEPPEVARPGPVGSGELPPAYKEHPTPRPLRSANCQQGPALVSQQENGEQGSCQPSELSSGLPGGSAEEPATQESAATLDVSTAVNQSDNTADRTSASSTSALQRSDGNVVSMHINSVVNMRDNSTVNGNVNTIMEEAHNASQC